MISDYEVNSVYEIFENQENNKKFKIGEIEKGVFYDLNKKGKRIQPGFHFINDYSFWNQFHNITIKKIPRPLDGYEPIVWGAYWTLSAILSIILVTISGIENQIFWIITSVIHFAITVKFRYNKIVVYWMVAVTVFVLLILWMASSKKKIRLI
jgi:hypothetical protein